MQITPGDLNKKVSGSDNLWANAIEPKKEATYFLKRGHEKGLPVRGLLVSAPPPS